jgi:hypothetical protein
MGQLGWRGTRADPCRLGLRERIADTGPKPADGTLGLLANRAHRVAAGPGHRRNVYPLPTNRAFSVFRVVGLVNRPVKTVAWLGPVGLRGTRAGIGNESRAYARLSLARAWLAASRLRRSFARPQIRGGLSPRSPRKWSPVPANGRPRSPRGQVPRERIENDCD